MVNVCIGVSGCAWLRVCVNTCIPVCECVLLLYRVQHIFLVSQHQYNCTVLWTNKRWQQYKTHRLPQAVIAVTIWIKKRVCEWLAYKRVSVTPSTSKYWLEVEGKLFAWQVRTLYHLLTLVARICLIRFVSANRVNIVNHRNLAMLCVCPLRSLTTDWINTV